MEFQIPFTSSSRFLSNSGSANSCGRSNPKETIYHLPFEGDNCLQIVSKPGLATTEGAAHSAYQRFENVKNFLVAIDDLRLPTFEASDLEQGNMVTVVDCLLSLKEFYDSKNGVETQSLWKQGADTGIPNDIKSTVRGTSLGKPGLATTEGAAHSAYQRFENVRNFLVAIDDLRLPTFEASDLEQGNMVTVVDCLLSLKEFYDSKNRVETQSLWKQGADTGIPNDIKSTVRGTSPGKSLNTTLKSGSQPRKRWVLPDLENCAALDNQVTDQSSGVNGPKVVKLPLRFDAETLLSSAVMSSMSRI